MGDKVLLLRHCPIADFDFGFDALIVNVRRSHLIHAACGMSHPTRHAIAAFET